MTSRKDGLATAASISAAMLLGKRDWTVDDLESLPEDLRYELIEGRLTLLSPTGIHQYISMRVVFAPQVGCPDDLLAVPSISLKVNCRNELCPDVVVISEKLAGVSSFPIESAVSVAEVLSPGSAVNDLHVKPKVYAVAGLPSYWVVDPFHDAGVVLAESRFEGGGQHALVTRLLQSSVRTCRFPSRWTSRRRPPGNARRWTMRLGESGENVLLAPCVCRPVLRLARKTTSTDSRVDDLVMGRVV